MFHTPRLIGIAGPSCAGKGELCAWLARELQAPVLPIDAYYQPLDHLTPSQRAAVNFDEPASIDDALLINHLGALARGEAIEQPHYDFSSHTRAHLTTVLEPREFILVEGLFTLYWSPVREVLTASVYISAPDEVCLARRLDRDQRERGRTAESVISQYQNTVQPMRRQYVEPTMRHAGIVLDGQRPVPENGEAALAYLAKKLSLAAVAG